jgi:hypothetical protein
LTIPIREGLIENYLSTRNPESTDADIEFFSLACKYDTAAISMLENAVRFLTERKLDLNFLGNWSPITPEESGNHDTYDGEFYLAFVPQVVGKLTSTNIVDPAIHLPSNVDLEGDANSSNGIAWANTLNENFPQRPQLVEILPIAETADLKSRFNLGRMQEVFKGRTGSNQAYKPRKPFSPAEAAIRFSQRYRERNHAQLMAAVARVAQITGKRRHAARALKISDQKKRLRDRGTAKLETGTDTNARKRPRIILRVGQKKPRLVLKFKNPLYRPPLASTVKDAPPSTAGVDIAATASAPAARTGAAAAATTAAEPPSIHSDTEATSEELRDLEQQVMKLMPEIADTIDYLAADAMSVPIPGRFGELSKRPRTPPPPPYSPITDDGHPYSSITTEHGPSYSPITDNGGFFPAITENEDFCTPVPEDRRSFLPVLSEPWLSPIEQGASFWGF